MTPRAEKVLLILALALGFMFLKLTVILGTFYLGTLMNNLSWQLFGTMGQTGSSLSLFSLCTPLISSGEDRGHTSSFCRVQKLSG